MKKLLLFVVLITQMTLCSAQQFSFQLFFTDAVGNKDTITLGYDLTATDSIEASFGEVNIITVPLDTNLDVRITNEWYEDTDPIYFHTKKQIGFYDCTPFNWCIQPINIFTHHWPVTMMWDSSSFNDLCRAGSVFTGVNPGTWWDVSCPSDLWRQILPDKDSVTFTSNFELGWYGYINGYGDSIPVFWQAFGDSTIIYTGINEPAYQNNLINVFPNPASDFVSIYFDSDFGQFSRLEIFNSYGQLIQTSVHSDNIDIENLASGIYFLRVKNTMGLTVFTKIQKL